MKIVVFTITCNRLDLTKQYLSELKQNTSIDYEHIIVDNGSNDDTIEWLKENGYKIIKLQKNYGIIKAMKIAIKYISDNYDCDLIIKYDNDCKIHTNNILENIIEFYKNNGLNNICAPDDIAILELQRPVIFKQTNNLRYSSHVGGIFKVMPIKAAKLLLNQPDDIVGGDLLRGRFWKTKGIESVYLMNLKIEHKGIGKQTKNYKLK